jgi:hypothetical protein
MGSLYRSRHELIGVFKNGKAPHRNNVELGRHGRNRTNVWTYPGVTGFGRQNEEGALLERDDFGQNRFGIPESARV